MDIQQIMTELKEKSNPSRKKSLLKAGAPENTYGVLLGVLRKTAKTIGINHDLALQLWATKQTDARLLAVMLFDPKKLKPTDVYNLIEDITFDQLLDDFMFRAGVHIKDTKRLFEMLMADDKDMLNRAAWTIQVDRIKRKAVEAHEIEDILEYIRLHLKGSRPLTKWMMNYSFAQIGISYPTYRSRVLSLAQTLEVYKDMKVAPGCTSAYVPYWIAAVTK